MPDFKYEDTKVVTIKVYPQYQTGSYKVRLQVPEITTDYIEAWITDNLNVKNVQSWDFWDEANSKW